MLPLRLLTRIHHPLRTRQSRIRQSRGSRELTSIRRSRRTLLIPLLLLHLMLHNGRANERTRSLSIRSWSSRSTVRIVRSVGDILRRRLGVLEVGRALMLLLLLRMLVRGRRMILRRLGHELLRLLRDERRRRSRSGSERSRIARQLRIVLRSTGEIGGRWLRRSGSGWIISRERSSFCRRSRHRRRGGSW